MQPQETSKKPLASKLRARLQAASFSGSCVEDQDDGSGMDTLLKPTILGYRLINNPYSLVRMQQAHSNLFGNAYGVAITHKYIRMKPSSPAQLSIIEQLDIDWFDHPLDYDVIQEGDYYDDGVTPAEEIPWLYAVVDLNFSPPAGIQYQVLEEVHIPQSAAVENESFRITGNPYDDPSCGGGSGDDTFAGDTLEVEHNNMQCPPYACVPGYWFDPSVCDCVPLCPPGFVWNGADCVASGPPQPMLARQPSGSLTVFDNNFNSNVPVRNARIVARRYLKIERTHTDNQGQFYITKEFNKVHLLAKFKNTQAKIRALRKARLWQMLFAAKRSFGKFRGNLNNLPLHIAYNADARTDLARDWAAATVHNNVQEYHAFAAQQGIGVPPDNIRVLITNRKKQGVGGAAPMYAKRVIQELPEDFLRFFVIGNGTPLPASLLYVLKSEIDVTMGYNLHRRLDREETAVAGEISEVMFHELTHAAHYNKVGNAWWNDFVDAELNNIIWHRNQNPPYGLGNQGATSDIISTGESWAYHMGHFLADRKYGLNSSETGNGQFTYQNNFIPGFSSHLSALEDFNPNLVSDLDRWIPQGLFLDLIDTRNETGVPVFDGVQNFTNQRLFAALDVDVRSIPQYRERLIAENPGNQALQIRNLFTQYNIP